MAIVKLIILLVLFELNISWILGHGMMLDPVNRASAWRLGFNTPEDYDDNAFFCGGANVSPLFYFKITNKLFGK